MAIPTLTQYLGICNCPDRKGNKLPAKVERCVRRVKKQGHSKVSAIKICRASINK